MILTIFDIFTEEKIDIIVSSLKILFSGKFYAGNKLFPKKFYREYFPDLIVDEAFLMNVAKCMMKKKTGWTNKRDVNTMIIKLQ